MNPLINQLLELAKYTVPALIAVYACYALVQKFLSTQLQREQLTVLQDTQHITIPLRLQAYERLAIFIERIHFRTIIPRIYQKDMNVADLRYALVYTLNAEFEHNISQQIYVSRQVWQTVHHTKEQAIAMVHTLAQQLDPEAPARDLQLKLMDYLVTAEEALPGEMALGMINEEARKVLSFGPQASA